MRQGIGVYPVEDERTATVRLLSPPASAGTARSGWARMRGPRYRTVAIGVGAALLVAGAVAGERAAVAYIAHGPDPYAVPGADPIGAAGTAAPRGDNTAPTGAAAPKAAAAPTTAAPPTGAAAPTRTAGTGTESRVAWARQYGQRRAAMPNLPDVALSSPQQRAAASNLLSRIEAGTAAYTSTDAAQAAGYDFAAGLAHAKGNPRTARRMARINGGATALRPVVVRAVDNAVPRDRNVLDAGAPQALIYSYQGHNAWKLVGAGFRADGAYPKPPPDPGGPITRWRYADLHPASLTMDVYFVAAGDLAHAYALMPPSS
jgi:hypothetical protein